MRAERAAARESYQSAQQELEGDVGNESYTAELAARKSYHSTLMNLRESDVAKDDYSAGATTSADPAPLPLPASLLGGGGSASGADTSATPRWSLVRVCERVTRWRHFATLIHVLILCNTITQCLAYPAMSASQCRALDAVSFGFACAFLLEMGVKLAGLGLRGYARDRSNLFDGSIVILNIVDIAVTASQGGGPWVADRPCSSGLNLSVFRTLRLARLLRAIPSKFLLAIVVQMAEEVAAVTLIFALFLYVWTLLGMSCTLSAPPIHIHAPSLS